MNTFRNLQIAFSLKSFVVAAILFSLFTLSGHFALVNGQSACGLGKAWDEYEVSSWHGTWTRRGSSNVFDAHWEKLGNSPIDQILTINIKGSSVKIHRQDPNIVNNTCSYSGTIASDGVSVSGEYTCNNQGWVLGPFSWSAKIDCSKTPKVNDAEITKMRQWIAHYENLINQWIQYRDKQVLPYYNHPTYYQWARKEYERSNQTIRTLQQNKAYYQNLLRQAGAQ